jgi:alpha-L-rhamnosidase
MLKSIVGKVILFTLIFIIMPFVNEYSNCNPTNLRVNYRINPIGIDNGSPMFSWQINDSGAGAKQTAWQILVASSSELLKNGKPDMWDSGKQLSSKNKQILFGGTPLKSCSRYFWSVIIWDKENQPSKISEPVFFETAYLDSTDWKGNWITNTEDTASFYSPYIRKVIQTHGKPVSATAYIAGIYPL